MTYLKSIFCENEHLIDRKERYSHSLLLVAVYILFSVHLFALLYFILYHKGTGHNYITIPEFHFDIHAMSSTLMPLSAIISIHFIWVKLWVPFSF